MNLDQTFNTIANTGNQMLAQDRANASKYSSQYGTDVSKYNQANQAAQNAQKQYQTYNENMVDPTTLYKQALGDAQTSVGFNPGQLGQATQALTRMQGTLNGLVGDQNMGANAQGLGATALAQQYQSNLQPLQAGLATQTSAVGNLSNLYGQTLTQANQQAGLGFQGEQLKSQNYGAIAQNALQVAKQAQDQAAQSLQQMQFYSDLAQKQGGFNSTNAQNYAAAKQALAAAAAAYAAASQSYAQAKLLGSQTTGQNIANQAAQAQFNASRNPATALSTRSVGLNSVGVPSQGISIQGSNSGGMGPGGLRLQ